MTPPRWPFLVEIDALTQLNMFYATDKRTTVPLGMRIVGRNLERDTYFVAPLGLHLLYRRLMRRYDKAQQVLARLRESNVEPQPAPAATAAWPPYQGNRGSVTITTTAAVSNANYPWQSSTTFHQCTCLACQPVLSSTPQTP